jgi:hypothetical protein
MIGQALKVRPWAVALCAALSVGSIAACGSDKEKKSDTATQNTAAATTSATHPTTSTQATTSSTPSFDLSQFEANVAQQLSGAGAGAQAGGTTTHVTEVQCPDSTTPTAGEGVDCDAMGDGGLTGNVTITFKDDTGQAYSYKAKLQIGNTTQSLSGSVTGK